MKSELALKLSYVIAIIFCAVSFRAYADSFTFPAQPKHLLPLDGRGVDLYQGFGTFVDAVASKPDYPLSAIYVWPASKPGVFIAIYQTKDQSSYYLEYALDTKPIPSVSKRPLPAIFAKSISERLAKIIAKDMQYPEDGKMPILCTDGTEYVFQSGDLYGRSMCPASGSAAKLEQFADKLIELAELKTTSADSSNQKMAELISMLDDVNN